MPLNEETYINKEENTMEKNNVESLVLYNIMEQRITGAATGEKKYYFNSLYNDNDMVEAWCNQHDISHYRTVALVFGFANGAYIKELRNRNKEMKIVVYEPSPDIVEKQRSQQEVVEIINDKNIEIVHDEKRMYGILAEMPDYEIIKYIKVFVTPNYDIVYEKEFGRLKVLLEEHENRLRVNRNTTKVFGKTMMMNAANNLLDCVKQYSVYNLKKEFDRLKKDKIPAIVVAAGPSLDKNISQLKLAKGKAFIIAVDTALKPLAQADILPDISVTADPNKFLPLFDNEKIKEIPLVFDISSNEKIKSIHNGMRIYYNTDGTLISRYMSMFQRYNLMLETGGSVAHVAFSVAQILGFKTIIFVGQDLAYPNDKGHAAASFGEGEENDIKNQNKVLFEVEDIYGGKVKTEYNMNEYRIWFERAVLTYPDIRFIDATEGGAKKAGMEIMTLKEAIERECDMEKYIDFHDVISHVHHTFSSEEQRFILKDIGEFNIKLDIIRKRLKEGRRLYEKLDVLNRKHEYTGDEFEEVIRNITEINKFVSDDNVMQYLTVYIAETDFGVRDTIYEQKDNAYEDMELIIQNGIKMMDALFEATGQAEEDLKAAMEQARTEAALD